MNLLQNFTFSQTYAGRISTYPRMRPFWKSPWMKSKISLGDDQRDQLLPEKRDVDQLSADEIPSQAAIPRERYVGYGIGGAGNIRRVKPRGAAEVKAGCDTKEC
ncbi:hypothetical protein BJX76DRAFT_342686 [Aspergillus varians]